MLRNVGTLMLVVLAATGGPSLALTLDAAAPGACEPRHVPGLGQTCVVAPGLFRVVLPDGTVLHTHGPDPKPADGDDAAFGLDDGPASPVCADAPHTHVLYGHPPGRDRTAEVVEEIREAVRRMDAAMRTEAMESGGVTASYRVKCDVGLAIMVDAFQGPATGSWYTLDFDKVVSAARAAGFVRAATNYLVFYDGTSPGVCGVANNALDDRLAPDNANLKGPNYAVVYSDCWSGRTPMHESGHNMGAVQRLAPFSDLNGHCLEGYDVMCYTGEILPLCADRTHFDCNHDTYFSANPAPGSWLATHWNVGSRLNRYLAFSDAPPPAEPEPAKEPEPANQTQETNSSDVPVVPPSQEPARENETLAPQSVPDAAAPLEATQVPGPSPIAAALAVIAAAALRRRGRA